MMHYPWLINQNLKDLKVASPHGKEILKVNAKEIVTKEAFIEAIGVTDMVETEV